MKRVILCVVCALLGSGCMEISNETWEGFQIAKDAPKQLEAVSANSRTTKNVEPNKFAEELLRRRKYEIAAKEWRVKVKIHKINLGLLSAKDIGLTKNQALVKFGYANDINRSVGRWGVHEQWVYDHCYLYFENEILTSWQD